MRKGLVLGFLLTALLLAIIYFVQFDYDENVIDTVNDTKVATLRLRVASVVKAIQTGIVLEFMEDPSQIPKQIDEMSYLDSYRGDMPLCISLTVKNVNDGEYRFDGKLLFKDYTVEIQDNKLLEDSVVETSMVSMSACVNSQAK